MNDKGFEMAIFYLKVGSSDSYLVLCNVCSSRDSEELESKLLEGMLSEVTHRCRNCGRIQVNVVSSRCEGLARIGPYDVGCLEVPRYLWESSEGKLYPLCIFHLRHTYGLCGSVVNNGRAPM